MSFVIGVHTTQINWRMLWTTLKLINAMNIELLYMEIHLKKSFAAIPPDSIVYIERENVKSGHVSVWDLKFAPTSDWEQHSRENVLLATIETSRAYKQS